MNQVATKIANSVTSQISDLVPANVAKNVGKQVGKVVGIHLVVPVPHHVAEAVGDHLESQVHELQALILNLERAGKTALAMQILRLVQDQDPALYNDLGLALD